MRITGDFPMRRRSKLLLILSLVLIVFGLAGLMATMLWAISTVGDHDSRIQVTWSKNWISRQVAKLSTAQTTMGLPEVLTFDQTPYEPSRVAKALGWLPATVTEVSVSLGDGHDAELITRWALGLRHLRKLSLLNCSVTDEMLAHISEMPELQSLQLTGNDCRFHSIFLSATVQHLILDSTNLDNVGLKRALSFPSLRSLSIVGNLLSLADLKLIEWRHPTLKTLVLGWREATDAELKAFVLEVSQRSPELGVIVNNGHLYLPFDLELDSNRSLPK
jgi:hypothetical protein